MLELTSGDWRATLEPPLGGALLSLSWRGEPILRSTTATDTVRATACYPMIPYANRIALGRFTWADKDYGLQANFPGSPHPLHGVGWRRPWQVVDRSKSACELSLDFIADQDWPFPFEARQRIALGADGLSVGIALTNTASHAAPLGFGYHPYFVRRGGDRLSFSAEGVWDNGPDMLPDGFMPKGPGWDLVVAEKSLDHDFSAWGGEVRITADQGPALRLAANMPWLRIFTPAERGFFAVEPVSHGTDAINRGGMSSVAPGDSVTGWMTIGIAA